SAGLRTPQKGAVITDGEMLVLDGVNSEDRGIEGKLKFQSRIRILNTGGMRQTGSGCGADACINVKNADSATLLLSAATSYKNYHDVSAAAAALARVAIEKASRKT